MNNCFPLHTKRDTHNYCSKFKYKYITSKRSRIMAQSKEEVFPLIFRNAIYSVTLDQNKKFFFQNKVDCEFIYYNSNKNFHLHCYYTKGRLLVNLIFRLIKFSKDIDGKCLSIHWRKKSLGCIFFLKKENIEEKL